MLLNPSDLLFAADVVDALASEDWDGDTSQAQYSAGELRTHADMLDAEKAKHEDLIERAAIIAYHEHEMGIRGDGQSQPWEQRTEGSKSVFRNVVSALHDAGLLKG